MVLRIFLSVILFYGTSLPMAVANEEPGLPIPEAPGKATADTCGKYAMDLYNFCYNKVNSVVLQLTNADAGVRQANASSNADKAQAVADTTSYASQLEGLQMGLCQESFNKCIHFCDQANTNHAQKSPPEVAKAESATETKVKVCGAIEGIVQEKQLNKASLANHELNATKTADALKGDSKGLMSNLSKYSGALTTLGAVAGTMCLMGTVLCKEDKDDRKTLAEGDIDCNLAENHVYSKCETHYVNLCLANPTGTGCSQFSDHYCGIATGEETSSSTGSALGNDSGLDRVESDAGVGSSFCEYQTAYNFCEDSGTSTCPSCRQLSQMSSAVCKNNPAVCLPSWTEAQLEEAASYCPTDPMFASSSAIASGSTSDTESGDDSDQLDNSTESLSQLSDGSTALSYGVQSATSASTSAQSLAKYSVGSAFGSSLFKSSTEVVQTLCDQGQLDYCGPREGLNY